jgi:hypothetical protein
MLKSLGLWRTTYEEKQKVYLDVEGDSVGLHQVNEEDTLTGDAATPTDTDMAVVTHEKSSLSHSAPDVNEEDTLAGDAAKPTDKHMAVVTREESSLSHSAPDMENAGILSPLEVGYGLRRRFSANRVSDQMRCGCPCHIYTIECPF